MRLKMMSGGDSVDYDELTAKPEDVPEGLVFMGAGSEDTQTGEMPNRKNMHGAPGYSDADPDIPVHQAVMASVTKNTYGENQIVVAPPEGAYPGDTTAFVGCSPSVVGVTAEKIANGQQAAGVTGTYGADGNFSAGDLKAGKVGYGAKGRVQGEGVDYGSVSKTLAAGESYSINKGFYDAGKITAKDLASQTDGDADSASLLEGLKAWVKGKLLVGSMKNLSSGATITHTSSNATKVILGDAAYQSKNSDGTERVQIRYNGTNGFVTGNTLFAVPLSIMANALGLTAAKIKYGEKVCGITGTQRYADNLAKILIDGSYAFTAKSYSMDSAGTKITDASVNLGVVGSGYPYLILQFGIKIDGDWTVRPVWYAIGSNASRHFELPIKNSMNAATVGIVIARTSAGEMTVKFTAGTTTGTYGIKMVAVAGTNCTVTNWS